jgi:hypothetical protein
MQSLTILTKPLTRKSSDNDDQRRSSTQDPEITNQFFDMNKYETEEQAKSSSLAAGARER